MAVTASDSSNNSTTSSSSTSTSTTSTDYTQIQDNGHSVATQSKIYIASSIYADGGKDAFNDIKRSHNLYAREDIDIFGRRYRFGLFNPYETLSTTREFLFFTKPDLNIQARSSSGELLSRMTDALTYQPYFIELAKKYDSVLQCLQLSRNTKDPFNHLLENMCISNLSIPSLEAETVDTPSNAYGVNYQYRGSSEASNDGFDFDLEFKDTKYLPVYHFFKAYEEYETLKHHGTIGPWKGYIEDKVLHDQFAIYKFLVDEDMETIVYYCKYYGVFPKSLPRDIFSSATFESGLSYSISFKCAFFEDMDPMILYDFNELSKSQYNSLAYNIDIYNEKLCRIDNRPVQAAYIVEQSSMMAPGRKLYKLKWKGSDTY